MGQILDSDGLELTWEVALPYAPHASEDLPIPPWLSELRAFRGSVLFGSGPVAGSAYYHETADDPDPYDGICHHLIVRRLARIVGCVRVSRELAPCEVAGYLGRAGLAGTGEWLHHLPGPIGAVGRWIVAPEHRSLSLALQLVAASYALARMQGICCVLGTVGTLHGQARILERTGAIRVMDAGEFLCPVFPDPLHLYQVDIFRPAPRILGMVESMARRIGRLVGIPTSIPAGGA